MANVKATNYHVKKEGSYRREISAVKTRMCTLKLCGCTGNKIVFPKKVRNGRYLNSLPTLMTAMAVAALLVMMTAMAVDESS
jgi:hypothetical protein